MPSLKRSTIPHKKWVNAERKVIAHWTEFGERLWTVSERRTQMDLKEKGECTLNAMLMQDVRFIQSA